MKLNEPTQFSVRLLERGSDLDQATAKHWAVIA